MEDFAWIISLQEPKLNCSKIHSFFWIWSTSGKIMVSYVSKHENGGVLEILVFCYFLSKISCQEYGAWVPGTHSKHMRSK